MFQEPDWRSVTKDRMLPLPVVGHPEVLEVGDLHVSMGGVPESSFKRLTAVKKSRFYRFGKNSALGFVSAIPYPFTAMKKIIREKYENGVLVSREIEASGSLLPRLAKLGIHLVVAVSLATIAVVSVRDSLTMDAIGQATEMTDTACPAPSFRS